VHSAELLETEQRGQRLPLAVSAFLSRAFSRRRSRQSPASCATPSPAAPTATRSAGRSPPWAMSPATACRTSAWGCRSMDRYLPGDKGRVAIVSGRSGREIQSWRSDEPGYGYGRFLAAALDLDGDGVTDLLAGGPYFVESRSGRTGELLGIRLRREPARLAAASAHQFGDGARQRATFTAPAPDSTNSVAPSAGSQEGWGSSGGRRRRGQARDARGSPTRSRTCQRLALSPRASSSRIPGSARRPAAREWWVFHKEKCDRLGNSSERSCRCCIRPRRSEGARAPAAAHRFRGRGSGGARDEEFFLKEENPKPQAAALRIYLKAEIAPACRRTRHLRTLRMPRVAPLRPMPWVTFLR
jgi:hypothetical protein